MPSAAHKGKLGCVNQGHEGPWLSRIWASNSLRLLLVIPAMELEAAGETYPYKVLFALALILVYSGYCYY